MITWLSITMHYKVTDFMSQVETLAVVVTFKRIHDYYRTSLRLKRVGIDTGNLKRAEYTDYAVALGQTQYMVDRTCVYSPRLP